jgi:hypothetical protein
VAVVDGTPFTSQTDTVTGTVSDDGGNTIFPSDDATVTILPKSAVTNSSLCYFDTDPITEGQQFRLLFTPDKKNGPYKLNASNPGQFFYNVFLVGDPGTEVTLTMTTEYPWVTQGNKPIHVYDGVGLGASGEGFTCFEPGQEAASFGEKIVLGDYVPQDLGVTTQVEIVFNMPASGFAYVNMHLDYGLKGTTGYSQGAGGDAMHANGAIPNNQAYLFSFGSSTGTNDSQTAHSQNQFQ